jgi:hypothetical protein
MRRLSVVALALASGIVARAEELPAGVTYGGTLEPRGSPRGQLQWLVLEIASAWATCDAEKMAALVHDDIDLSFPTTRLKGRAAVVEDLDHFCGPNVSNRATEVSFWLPADAFYIDERAGRVAVEIQFRATRGGQRQVVNDVWIATVRDDRFSIIKEYLDGRVRDLQAQGVLTYDTDAPFLTPWPPRSEAWRDCFPIVRAAPVNACPAQR